MAFPLAPIIGAAIGAGGELLGGMFGANAAKSGAKKAARSSLKAMRKNLRYQKQFAAHGVRWRVKDAKKAGIHPLAALGAQLTSFTPSFVGTGDGGRTAAGAAWADALGDAGQNIGRAVEAYSDDTTRQVNNAYVAKVQALQIQNMELQNAALASDIALRRQPGHPPGSATNPVIDGQSKSLINQTGYEDKVFPDASWSRNPDGSFSLYPSNDAKNRMEDNTAMETQWIARAAHLIGNGTIKPYEPPQGKKWQYDVITNRAYLVDGYVPKVATRPDLDYSSPQTAAGGWLVKRPNGWDFNF